MNKTSEKPNKIKFNELKLSNELQRAITDMGFEEATPIQSMTIPVMMEGKDVCGQAQTGTGKTAAFGIPILEKIDCKDKTVQSIVLCPTRELAIQVAEELKSLSKYKRNVYVLPVYGGQPIERQLYALERGVQVVIGTPGRVLDHIERGTLKLNNVKIVILDEADVMLDMGFIEDIESILKHTPSARQTAFFSATMPGQFLSLTKRYQKHPVMIKVVHHELTVPEIEQVYFETSQSMKIEVLSRLIDIYDPNLALIFCNTKKGVDDLVGHLQTRGYSVEGLHGDMRQVQRDRVMAKFRKQGINILVATDVAARGIDVDDVEIVFNYDIPQDEEYYVHRIGRTARAGKTGQAFSLVTGREIYKLRDIQRYAKITIKRQPVPTTRDVEEVKFNSLLDKVRNVINEGQLGKYSHIVEKLLTEEFTSLDIAAALLKMVIGPGVEGKESKKTGQADFEDTGASESGMVRFFMNIGRDNGVTASNIVGAIANEADIPAKSIGAIKIFDKYSFVEITQELASQVAHKMKDKNIKGKRINIEPAKPRNN